MVIPMRYHFPVAALSALTLFGAVKLHAQRPTLAPAVRAFVTVDTPVVALTHARVIDGTGAPPRDDQTRSEEHTSELQSHSDLVCRLLLEKKKKKKSKITTDNQRDIKQQTTSEL